MGKNNYRDMPDERFRETTASEFYFLEGYTKKNFVVLKRDGKLYLTFDQKLISYFNGLRCHKCSQCRSFYYDECSRIASGIIPLDDVEYGYVVRTATMTFHGVIKCRAFNFMYNISIPRDKCEHTGGRLVTDLDDDELESGEDDEFNDGGYSHEVDSRFEALDRMARGRTNTGTSLGGIYRYRDNRDKR